MACLNASNLRGCEYGWDGGPKEQEADGLHFEIGSNENFL